MKTRHEQLQSGVINIWLIPVIVLSVLVVTFGGLALWAYTNYNDQKTNVDSKIAVAVANAKKAQSDADQAKYLEQEKQPYRTFNGPAQLGSVSFTYPKTWSVYQAVNNPALKGTDQLQAYLYPDVVPPVSESTPFALKVTIVGRDYASVLRDFNDRIKLGKLKSAAVSADGQNGTRLDGSFSTTIQGTMVLFQIRNSTLMVAVQSPNFTHDFETAVLPSLKFNP